MKLAIYIRVSDKDKQGNNFSPASQEKAMIEYATAQGWEYVVFLEMEGASEFSQGIDRTKLNEIRQLAKEKKIQGIMYYKPDRFTRDLADGIVLRREFYRLGVKVFCYYPYPHEVEDTNEIMNVINDYQSQSFVRNMREASMRGYQEKKKAGLFPSGRVPYGYKLEGKKRDSKLVLHSEHSKVVEMIFSMFVYYNKSTGEIAKELQSMGIPAITKVSRIGWTGTAVRKIIRNKAYTGTWVDMSGKMSLSIPAIITEEVFERANTRQKKALRGRVYTLSGVSECSCGAYMTPCTKKRKAFETRYYTCGRGMLIGQGRKCKPWYRADDIETKVWSYVRSLILDPERLEAAFYVLTNGAYTEIQERIASIELEITQKEEDLSNLIALLARTKQPTVAAVIEQQINQAGEILEQLTARKQELFKQKDNRLLQMQYKATLQEFCNGIRDEIQDIDTAKDAAAIKQIIAMFQIKVVFSATELKIYWRGGEETISVQMRRSPIHVIPLM